MKLNKNAGRFVLLAIFFGAIATFYPKTPDVRLSLCQDLTQSLIKPAQAHWQTHEIVVKGYHDLEVKLQFAQLDSKGQQGISHASCFFPYVQDDIEAETFQTPSAAYSSYPDSMALNDIIVDKTLLHQTIQKIIKQQGKELIKKLTQ